MDSGAARRLENVLLKLKDKPMHIDESGETSRTPVLRQTRIFLNSLMKGSPLHSLVMAHELDHASRSVTLLGRLERFWNYKFIQKEEGSAAATEYRILKAVLKKYSVEKYTQLLEDRYIDNRHINKHKIDWHKKGWIDDYGVPTSQSVLLLLGLSAAKPDSLAKTVAEDPALKSFVVKMYDDIFLEKLKLADSADLDTYVSTQLQQYTSTNQKHQMILSIIHGNGLMALVLGISQLF